MIRLILADTKRTAIVQAAGKSVGLTVSIRALSQADLDALQAPVLLVVDAGGRFTPDSLQAMRRGASGGLRLSPTVVFCPAKDTAVWRGAGVVAIADKAGVDDVVRAIKFATSAERRWISSAGYVGPDRRTKDAFQVFGRRSEDTPANENAKPAAKRRFW